MPEVLWGHNRLPYQRSYPSLPLPHTLLQLISGYAGPLVWPVWQWRCPLIASGLAVLRNDQFDDKNIISRRFSSGEFKEPDFLSLYQHFNRSLQHFSFKFFQVVSNQPQITIVNISTQVTHTHTLTPTPNAHNQSSTSLHLIINHNSSHLQNTTFAYSKDA